MVSAVLDSSTVRAESLPIFWIYSKDNALQSIKAPSILISIGLKPLTPIAIVTSRFWIAKETLNLITKRGCAIDTTSL